MNNELMNLALQSTNLNDFAEVSKLYPIQVRNKQPIKENIRGIFMDCLSIKDKHLEYYLDESHKVYDLSECSKLTSEGIKSIPSYAPNLTHLYLRAIPNLKSDCLESISTLSKLECLDLSQTYFDPSQ
ncbi:MAG: hypothetical protein Q8K60_00160, partial [Parachlamydiaceae bacterium]|nr:hypothetical protein [Parachlamydiaceae bacterium]